MTASIATTQVAPAARAVPVRSSTQRAGMPPCVAAGSEPAGLLAGQEENGTVNGLYWPFALPAEMPCQTRTTPFTPAVVAFGRSGGEKIVLVGAGELA